MLSKGIPTLLGKVQIQAYLFIIAQRTSKPTILWTKPVTNFKLWSLIKFKVCLRRYMWISRISEPKPLKQGSSENDGRSDVYDRLNIKIVANCCYPNCSHTNCGHFVNLGNLFEFTCIFLNIHDFFPEFTWIYLNLSEFTCI